MDCFSCVNITLIAMPILANQRTRVPYTNLGYATNSDQSEIHDLTQL